MCVAKGKEVICDLVRENEKEITNFGTFLFQNAIYSQGYIQAAKNKDTHLPLYDIK